MNEEDRRAARLLSGRDGMSVLEKEAVLDDVLRATARPARRRRTVRWMSGVTVLAAAAAVVWWRCVPPS